MNTQKRFHTRRTAQSVCSVVVGRDWIYGLIADRSDHGARIACTDPSRLPEHFLLFEHASLPLRHCRVVHRQACSVGVRFVA
jgi:hypothetical protein